MVLFGEVLVSAYACVNMALGIQASVRNAMVMSLSVTLTLMNLEEADGFDLIMNKSR